MFDGSIPCFASETKGPSQNPHEDFETLDAHLRELGGND